MTRGHSLCRNDGWNLDVGNNVEGMKVRTPWSFSNGNTHNCDMNPRPHVHDIDV